VVFLVIVVGGVGALGYSFMRARDSQADATAREGLPAGAVTADEIADVFATNAVAADEQYGHLGPSGHLVVGTVDRITKGDQGAVWLLFRTHRGPLPASFKSIVGLGSLTSGSTATLSCGRTLRAHGDPILIDCELESAR
jgi:hypothetical protein